MTGDTQGWFAGGGLALGWLLCWWLCRSWAKDKPTPYRPMSREEYTSTVNAAAAAIVTLSSINSHSP